MDEIVINEGTGGQHLQPAVVAVGAGFLGQFVVVWANHAQGTILARRFSPDGDAIGVELTVATAASPNAELIRPAVGARAGGFVVAWVERALNPPGPRPAVHMQRYDREGQKVGDPIQVSTSDVDTAHTPVIAFMADGGFLITWVNQGARDRIRARHFDSDGSPNADEFTVNMAEGFHERPIATHLAQGDAVGNCVIGWTTDPVSIGGGALRLRFFNFESSPVSDEIRPNLFGGESDIVLLPGGGFVVARISRGLEDDIGVEMSVVEVNIFEPDGLSNIEFSASSGRRINCSWPAVTSFQNGRFVPAWVQKRSDTFETSPVVNATVMSRDGHVSDVVQVSTSTAAHRSSVCAASIFGTETGDRVFVVWADDGGSGGSNFDIRGRSLQVSIAGGLS